MSRHVLLGAILIFLVGVSVWLWRAQRTETDPSLATSLEIYTCPNCQEQFEMSLAESGAMLRSNPGIICPRCRKVGAQKENAIIRVTGFGPGSGGEAGVTEEEMEGPPTQVGGLSRIRE